MPRWSQVCQSIALTQGNAAISSRPRQTNRSGIALTVGQIGQAVHPALERHADAQEVARQQLADAGEAGARIPQPATAPPGSPPMTSSACASATDVVAVADLADDEGAQHQHHHHQEQQQAVDQVDGVAGGARARSVLIRKISGSGAIGP